MWGGVGEIINSGTYGQHEPVLRETNDNLYQMKKKPPLIIF